MASDVYKAVVNHWQIAEYIPDLPPEGDPGYVKALTREAGAFHRRIAAKFLLSILAHNAAIVDEDTALVYMKQKNLAGAVGCTERHIRQLLTDLSYLGHIRIEPCDGSCAAKYRHGKTKHVYIKRPSAAPPWRNVGEDAQVYVYRGRTYRGKQGGNA